MTNRSPRLLGDAGREKKLYGQPTTEKKVKTTQTGWGNHAFSVDSRRRTTTNPPKRFRGKLGGKENPRKGGKNLGELSLDSNAEGVLFCTRGAHLKKTKPLLQQNPGREGWTGGRTK